MRAVIFLGVLGVAYTWPLFGDSPDQWSALSQGIVFGLIASTVSTPTGWKAIRRIRSRINGTFRSNPEVSE
ncbi:hypothetical protein CH254_22530 [Rhodococcus sp. 06-412-2C]|uniref:hypothetical protein n=1 Tax=unclassified Rhodococcus (in: high G+C Gram-positive bacteria) TaxID=192944 RepID=UPI000B9B530B|nr:MULTISPECIES: hypothetical protein [unclassified Rhodococcus (in: high G+C Gram-positive bacteria)]OZC83704.1 hypothetical protein CH254_22530 [Rhodococcus sp. 06-412-2C]OZC93891.1 hypothetical protein CH279_20610 [Rhodococcus sp. 06-412-2B]